MTLRADFVEGENFLHTHANAIGVDVNKLTDGTWYNVVTQGGLDNTGTTNIRSALQSLVDTVGGERVVYFPPGTYRLGSTGATSGTNRVTLPSGTHIEADPSAVFEVNQLDYASGTTVFYTVGAESAKVALTGNVVARSQQVTLPTGEGANFVRGDLIAFEANTAVTPDTADDTGVGLAREIRMITVISSDTITLDAPLEYAYATAASAVFSKITPARDIVFNGGKFTAGPGVTPGSAVPSPQLTYPIRFKWARDCVISNVKIDYSPGGIHLFECYNSRVDDCVIGGLMMQDVPATSAGYAVAFVGATTKCQVNRLLAYECRHAFTTLADERSGEVFWGGPMHCQVNDSVGYGATNGGTAVWDTHEFDRHLSFNNCDAYGGLDPCVGFQIRSQYATLKNCRGFNARIGLRIHKAASNVKVVGGEYAFNREAGALIDGTGHKLYDVDVHDNGGPGIGCYFSTCVDLRVDGGSIYNNASYGVQATDAVRPQFVNLNVPFSTGVQTTSYQSLSATAVVSGGTCMGYGTSVGTPSSTGAPASGCLLANIGFDGGVYTNRPQYVGGNGTAVYDTLFYRPSFNILRLDAIFRANDGEIQLGDPASNGVSVLMSSASPGGSPEGAVTANPGTLFLRRLGGANATVYFKNSGTGNTGWVALGPVSPTEFSSYVSGNYYHCNSVGAYSSDTLTYGRLRLSAWRVMDDISIDRLFFENTSAGDASSVMRLGVYTHNPATGKPGSLIVEAPTVSTSASGAVLQATIASTPIPRGLVWVGGAVQGSGTEPSIRTINGSVFSGLYPLGTSLPGQGLGSVVYYQNSVSGALPSTFSSSGDTSVAPRVGFRVV